MAKRYTDTNIWLEDWFIDLPVEYKLFWYYILSSCDHAGLFKVNLKLFCSLNGVKVESSLALKYYNENKERIIVISDNLWFISDFFVFQYGTTLNRQNRVHDSIFEIYNKYGIKMTTIRGLKDLKDRVKDKDKDNKTKYSNYTKDSKGGSGGFYKGMIGTLENIKQICPKGTELFDQPAVAISEDGNYAIFEDGFQQEMGHYQKIYARNNQLFNIKRGIIT